MLYFGPGDQSFLSLYYVTPAISSLACGVVH
jgi:hypothetical protein